MLGDGDHYVPILKSKTAEINALGLLGPLDKGRTTPLLEILPEQVSSEDKTKSFIRKISRAFGLDDPLFLDVSAVDAKKAILDLANGAGIRAAPVVRLDDSASYHRVVRPFDHACLRLDIDRLFSDWKPTKIPSLLDQLNKKASSVDLILDFGVIQQRSAPRNSEIAKVLLRQLPFLDQWRSIFVASTSFPTDLSGLEKDTESVVRREDWHMFTLLRTSWPAPVIGFSDYAIQHPDIAKLDYRIVSVSSQLRITQPNDWLLIKGRSIKTGGPEYIRTVCRKAVRQVEPPLDASFCWGDKFIINCAASEEGPGNASTWRQAGFSRHFAVVLSQLSDL